MKKRSVLHLLILAILFSLTGCKTEQPESGTLVYGSSDYTRINPAMDEHGEINLLLFNGLTAHGRDNQVVPCLAKDWNFDQTDCTYTFYLEEGVAWHDGAPFSAEDVKFTIEAIMDPRNGSENASNYEDVEEIRVIDDTTISFRLTAPNVAFLDYMTIPILPRHLLEGEDMQTSDFFRQPIGTGPYKLEHWEEGQSITLVKNDDYFQEPAQMEKIIFKIIADDQVRALQLQAGELDLAILPPVLAASFEEKEEYTCYFMETSDYRGILFNFHHEYWQENRDIIPAICYLLDRQAIVDALLLGRGTPAYSPLQRNVYYDQQAEHYDYSPQKAKAILEAAGCTQKEDGYYYRNQERIGFVISVPAGDQLRLDIARAAAQQLQEGGIEVSVEIPVQVDWSGQMAYVIGWGSPFDADDHTYKVFGTGKGANYSGYSNTKVDEYLLKARQSDDTRVREEAYGAFQKELFRDPAYAFICYVDACYVANSGLKGIEEDRSLGHHGTGIFWNITQWTLEK